MSINSVYEKIVDKTVRLFLKRHKVKMTRDVQQIVFFKKEDLAIEFRLGILVSEPEECFRQNIKKLLDALSEHLDIRINNSNDDLVKGSTLIFTNDINKKNDCEKINYILGGASLFAMFLCFYLL